jgi:hypothetical protein
MNKVDAKIQKCTAKFTNALTELKNLIARVAWNNEVEAAVCAVIRDKRELLNAQNLKR